MIIILIKIALLISFFMAIYLFVYTYIEALRISNAEDKVEGAGTFIFMSIMAFVFSGMTYLFI